MNSFRRWNGWWWWPLYYDDIHSFIHSYSFKFEIFDHIIIIINNNNLIFQSRCFENYYCCFCSNKMIRNTVFFAFLSMIIMIIEIHNVMWCDCCWTKSKTGAIERKKNQQNFWTWHYLSMFFCCCCFVFWCRSTTIFIIIIRIPVFRYNIFEQSL